MAGPSLRLRVVSVVATAGLVVGACGQASTTPSPAAATASPSAAASVAPGSVAPSSGTPSSATPSSEAPSASTGAGTPQKGGTAFILMTTATSNGDKFTDMDPQRIYIGEDIAFFSATIMRTLTQYKYSADLKEGTSLVPDAATDTGTPNADGTVWSFTLKDGMKWQDGSAVKCEDFAYGASRSYSDVIVNGPTYIVNDLKIPTNADGTSQYPGPYKATPDQQALFDKAVVCDGNKITYNLAKPVPDFNYTVTLGLGAVPNPKDHPGVDTGEQYTILPWSDGPYMIESYTPGKGGSLNLVRNPNWTDDGYRGAYPDKWVVQIGLDPQIVDGRMMQPNGDDAFALQYGNVQPQNLAKVFQSDAHTALPDFTGRAFSDLDPYVRYWWINQDKVKNLKIRQAMAVALDRDAIRAAGGGNFYGDPGDGLIKPNIGQDYAPTGWATDLFGKPVPPNGDADFAKQLIKDSGEAAPTLTFDYGKSPTGDQIAAIVQSSLQKAGFTIKLNAIESGYYAYIGDPAKQHDFGASGWGPDWPNASTVIPPLLFGAGKTNNASDYSRVTAANNPEFVKAMDAAGVTLDRAQQAAAWQAVNKEAVKQVFVIPNVFSLSQVIAGTKLGNLYKWPAYGSWPYAQIYVMP